MRRKRESMRWLGEGERARERKGERERERRIGVQKDMGSIMDYGLSERKDWSWHYEGTNHFGIVCEREVPRVFVGEQCVGGGSDIAELDQSGRLDGILQSIGALQASEPDHKTAQKAFCWSCLFQLSAF
ncbi:hypothetical protein JZ751_001105 [Albula glossodonta]|uniref:Uncharacterized protein n=1 Tax=Albula glossodonta TaxID=121402 RepID=A0A8T2PSK7_9TELE|nr:hypothetical protein JZ751_001105 [Albula glossodonta]